MEALFDVGVPAINKHLANVFETGELNGEATISKMETVQQSEEHLCKKGSRQGFSYRGNLGNFFVSKMQYVQNLHILHQAGKATTEKISVVQCEEKGKTKRNSQ